MDRYLPYSDLKYPVSIKNLEHLTLEERAKLLEKTLKGTRAEKITALLIAKGFLTCPASTKYHGNYEGGLFTHSYVMTEVLKSFEETGYTDLPLSDSPIVIGMLHDLCKLDCYNKEEDGTYSYNTNQLLSGHGWKSVILAQNFGVNLHPEEVSCIIYHMGAFTDKEEWKNYTNAIATYPSVLWVHTADMVASHIYNT